MNELEERMLREGLGYLERMADALDAIANTLQEGAAVDIGDIAQPAIESLTLALRDTR
jgi:hypothetical protein